MTWTGVLDTSAVIALPRLSSTAGVPERPVTTTVTFAELAVGPLVADDLQEQARRQAVLQQAEADLEALPFDLGAARAFGRVAAELRKAGRQGHGTLVRRDDRSDRAEQRVARAHREPGRLLAHQRPRRGRRPSRLSSLQLQTGGSQAPLEQHRGHHQLGHPHRVRRTRTSVHFVR